MAARKKSRATKPASKRPKARVVKKKAVAKAKANSSAKKAPARALPSKGLKDRRLPETLRLKSFTPSITVNDLGKSIAFYEGALGFFVGERWMDGDVLRGVMLKAGASEFALSQDDWKMGRDRKKGQGVRIWCDTSQDVDGMAARVKAAGFALTEEPSDAPSMGIRSFSVDDPDGFHLTISRDL